MSQATIAMSRSTDAAVPAQPAIGASRYGARYRVAGGEGLLAAYMGNGTSFVVGYLLASVAGILVGVAMLRAPVFHRAAAYAAIVANVLGLGLFLPGIGILLSLVSVVILCIWYAVIGWRLVRLPVGTPR